MASTGRWEPRKLWQRVGAGPRPDFLGTQAGPVAVIGPAETWKQGYENIFEKTKHSIVVNNAASFFEGDYWVTIHTEVFDRPSEMITVSGDSWVNEYTDYWCKLSNVGDSGIYSVLVSKLLGFDPIYVVGMPRNYDVAYDNRAEPVFGNKQNGYTKTSKDSLKFWWDKFSFCFDDVFFVS